VSSSPCGLCASARGVRTTANRAVSKAVRSDCVRRGSVTEPIPAGFVGVTMTVTAVFIAPAMLSKGGIIR
jgi:hypothetical protein